MTDQRSRCQLWANSGHSRAEFSRLAIMELIVQPDAHDVVGEMGVSNLTGTITTTLNCKPHD